MSPDDAYRELVALARDTAVLASCAAVLGWDEQTYMPKGASEHRGSQMALLAGIQHEARRRRGSASFCRCWRVPASRSTPNSVAAVNVRELRRGFDRRTKLPRSLVEELVRTTSLAQHEWVASRAANDFARFRPWLERIFQLKRQESACLAGGGTGRRSKLGGGSGRWPDIDRNRPGPCHGL